MHTDGGRAVYGELRGHENAFHEDAGEVGASPYLWGLSYENIVPVVLGLSALGDGGAAAKLSALGLDAARLDATWDAYRRLGSFQWVTSDVENSAFVSLTHVNASGLSDPPVGGAAPPAPPATPCDAAHWLIGAAALTIATGPDIRSIDNSSAADCCAACAASEQRDGARCASWFFNGLAGKCFLKSRSGPDHVTPPSDTFAAGYGPPADRWCAFTGSFQDPPAQACPAYGGKTCACADAAVIGKALGWELAWAAHKQWFTRLISMHRWLGQARRMIAWHGMARHGRV
jgi:hypothetical protein